MNSAWAETIVAGEHSWENLRHPSEAVTWYRPNSFYGNHEFRGFDYLTQRGSRSLNEKPVNYHLVDDSRSRGANGDVQGRSSTVRRVEYRLTQFS
jgi:hypothetical protein